MKISILVEICENRDFGQNFEKIRDFGQKVRKILILVEIFENLDFAEIVEIFQKYLDFGRNLSKISILVEICENLILGRNVLKSRFWSNFVKISF